MKSVYTAAAFLFLFAISSILIFQTSCASDSGPSLGEIELSPQFPDYSIDYSGGIENTQAQFNTKMWQTFLALCWPADDLKPVAKGTITAKNDARAVFENYSYNYDLFLLNVNANSNFSPVGWNNPDSLNAQRRARWKQWDTQSELCPDLIEAANSVNITNMAYILPMDEFIQASNGEKPHVPQIDLNQEFVLSSVLFNKPTYEFVVNNELYSPNGLTKAKKRVKKQLVNQVVRKKDASGKTYYKDTSFYQMVHNLTDSIGSMHLKTSWKVLGNDDDTSKFHTAWGAMVFNNLNFESGKQWQPQCSLVQVGLVGMHISIKTEDQPASIWATFEHRDNCPELNDIQDKHYNFYDYNSQKEANQPPKYNATVVSDPEMKHPHWFSPKGPSIDPSQIVRQVVIPDQTKALNTKYQNALGNSVWANYQLVGVQWIDPSSGSVYPKLLSNTTLETFEQLGSSCFGCHHQVTANTLKGGPNNDQFSMAPYKDGNVLNLKLNLFDPSPTNGALDTAIYSDYMWSLLKWTEHGQLTWLQVSNH